MIVLGPREVFKMLMPRMLVLIGGIVLLAVLLTGCGGTPEEEPPLTPPPEVHGYVAATSGQQTSADLTSYPNLVVSTVDLSAVVPPNATHALIEWSPCVQDISGNWPFTLYVGDPSITPQTPYFYVNWLCGSRPQSSTDVRSWQVKAAVGASRRVEFGVDSYAGNMSEGTVKVKVVGWWVP